MKRLIIIGAGGFGREILCYALDIQSKVKEWEIYGFINDDKEALDNYDVKYPIISTIKDYFPKEEDVFICAIGNPRAKMQICYEMKRRGANFISLIHPTAYIGQRVRSGEGLIMAPRTCVGPDVTLGNFVTINTNSSIGHDTVVGDGTIFYGSDVIAGNCVIGESVSIYLNASIAPKLKIGKNVTIGIGSVVIKNVKEGISVFGNPAKMIF